MPLDDAATNAAAAFDVFGQKVGSVNAQLTSFLNYLEISGSRLAAANLGNETGVLLTDPMGRQYPFNATGSALANPRQALAKILKEASESGALDEIDVRRRIAQELMGYAGEQGLNFDSPGKFVDYLVGLVNRRQMDPFIRAIRKALAGTIDL